MTKSAKKPNRPSVKVSAAGGWTDDDTTTNEGFDSRLGFSDTDLRSTLATEGEPGLYEVREREYNENPLFSLCIDSVVNHLLGFIVGGEGGEEVTTFLNETCPTAFQELRLALLSAVRDGTGFIHKYTSGKELKQIKTGSHFNYELEWIHRKPADDETNRDKKLDEKAVVGDTRIIEIKQNPPKNIAQSESSKETSEQPAVSPSNEKKTPISTYYLRDHPCMLPEDYRNDEFALLRLRIDDRWPYGQSVGRSSLYHMRALNQALKDGLAALKRMSSMQLGAALDLDDFDDGEEGTEGTKAYAKKQFSDSLKGTDWNSADVVSWDKRHDVGYIGMIAGTSSGPDGRLLDVLMHITPVLSVVLLNYFIALGVILQTGANKSIMAQQKLEARKRIKELERAYSSYLKTQVFYQITDKELKVYYPPRDMEYEIIMNLFATGVISREKAHELLEIDDDGETFSEDIQMQVEAKKASMAGDNHDDSTGGTRNEPQRSSSEGGV